MEINQNGIQVSTGSIPKKKQSTLKGRDLSGAIIQIADDHSAAVSRKDFQAKLNQIKNLSNEELVKFVKNFKEESIIEVICDEVGSSKDEREKACETVINTLVSRAKSLGYKTDYLQIDISGLIINTDRLDNIVNTLTNVIESRSKLTSKEINAINSRSEKTNRTKANTKIIERYNKAVRSFNTRVKDDGWAGITADAIGKIYGSKNTKEKVNNDLKVVLKQIGELKDANKKGDAAYKAKFKEVFGVEYDPVNIELFEKTEKKYLAAASAHEFETSFNNSCRVLLRNAPLREEYTQRCIDPQANIYVTDTVSKIQVYNREYDNLAKFISKEDIDAVLNKAGVSNKSIDEKFEVLKKIAQEISKDANAKTKKCCGKESFEQVQAGYEYAYKAAYGNNDIQKRVNDYCTSQLIGAEVVKAGATIAASVVAGFTGVGLVGVAAITAGASVVANVSDRATTENVREVYKKEGLKAATEKVIDDVDWEATLKQAATSGGAVLIGGGVAQGVMAIMQGQSTVAQFAAMLGSDVVTDAMLEFLTTKEITWQGMVFTVLLSTVGNAVQLKQMKNAADAALKKEFDMINTKRTNSIEPGTLEYNTVLSAYSKDPEFVEGLLNSKINCLTMDHNYSDIDVIRDAYDSKSISAILEIKEMNPELTELAVEALRGNISHMGWYTAEGIQEDNNIIEYIKQAILKDPEKVSKTLREAQQGKFLEGVYLFDDDYYYIEMLYHALKQQSPTENNVIVANSVSEAVEHTQKILGETESTLTVVGHVTGDGRYGLKENNSFVNGILSDVEKAMGRRNLGIVTTISNEPNSVSTGVTFRGFSHDNNTVLLTSEGKTRLYNIPGNQDHRSAYLEKPKLNLPNNEACSETAAKISDALIAIDGNKETVEYFCDAIKEGKKAIILQNYSNENLAWGLKESGQTSEVLNASKYLRGQLAAFLAGRELPYPASGSFTKEFMEAHKTELTNLVKFVDITMNNNRSSVLRYKDEKEIAGKILEFLKTPPVVK